MAVQPVHVGGHWQIVNVGWGGGVFVYVSVLAKYDQGAVGSRQVELTITKDGRDAGGKIIGEKTFHEPVSPTNLVATTLYRAVLRFSRLPKSVKQSFYLRLSGAIIVTNTTNPTPSVPPFCGTTTTTVTHTRYLTHFGGPGQTQVWQTDTWTITTPAGTGTFTNTFRWPM